VTAEYIEALLISVRECEMIFLTLYSSLFANNDSRQRKIAHYTYKTKLN